METPPRAAPQISELDLPNQAASETTADAASLDPRGGLPPAGADSRLHVNERESRLLISVAVGFGCLIILCLLGALVGGALALIWTLQDQLGPGRVSLSLLDLRVGSLAVVA